jgi:hypothetical protein
MSAVLVVLGLVAASDGSVSGCSAGGAGHVVIGKGDCESDWVHLSPSGTAMKLGRVLQMGGGGC